LVDEIGSQDRAIQRAAEWAHIANFEVANLRELAGLPEVVVYPFFMATEDGRRTAYPIEPGTYLLYIPPGERAKP
jgi:hypothetical protein